MTRLGHAIMSDKKKYEDFCSRNTDVPLFFQPWWLDAVCSSKWDAFVYSEGDRVFALMPYCLKRKYGFNTIKPPMLTPYGGVWFSYPSNISLCKKYSLEIKAMEYFSEQLKKLRIAFFAARFHHSVTNWLGFYWNGFKQTTFYTYRISGLDDMQSVFANIDGSVKKRIKKLEKDFEITSDLTTREFYEVNRMTYERQGVACPFSYDLFAKVEDACRQRELGRMFAIRDKEANVHSVAYVVVHNGVCYGLFSGTDPKYRRFNAATLLLWHIINHASQCGCREYDYTGSVMRPIETFIRHFGAIQTPYFYIEKRYSALYSFLLKLKG